VSTIDWIILTSILAGIIAYGIYMGKASKSINGYFLSDRSMPWYIVLLSIMGTQASAVTYLTGPGQAYSDGMRFLQYYFGLPFAMLVVAYVFVPVFNKLKVVTAYEFLETRFDAKTRTFTSFLFLLSRGLSTGISIYAPAIVLSALMGWNIYITNFIMGSILIIYTLSGGASAVAHTQKIQMAIVFTSLFLVFFIALKLMPQNVGFTEVLTQAKQQGKLNLITTGFTKNGFDWKDKYNIWSGLIGGFFLALSYFGTDHSQVGRYITAKNMKESQTGLLLNGLVKIPMQMLILFLGILAFVYYGYNKAPIYFDEAAQAKAMQTSYAPTLQTQIANYNKAVAENKITEVAQIKKEYVNTLKLALGKTTMSDSNFIFLRFVKDNLPIGLIGLLFAVIFLSAWGSIAAALNSLAACTVVDFHKRFSKKEFTSEQDVTLSKWYTLGWGVFCIAVSMFAQNIGDSLIEAVNILGSIFYGVILGIFLVAFFIKAIQAKAIFYAALVAQGLVILIYYVDVVSFLWLNVIGAFLVMAIATLFQVLFIEKNTNT
jgi:solute:Na+ symporter, SSS family